MDTLALNWTAIGKALLLLMLVNGAPIISRNLLKACLKSLRTAALTNQGKFIQRFLNNLPAYRSIDWLKFLRTLDDYPVDFAVCWFDGRPVFGNSKTWRGLFFALLTGSLAAPWLGFTWQQGACFAIYSMLGDLLSSFIKRRAGYPESSCFRVVDTVPESLLPVFLMRQSLSLSYNDIFMVVLLFSILEALLSPILYGLHIRKRPY